MFVKTLTDDQDFLRDIYNDGDLMALAVNNDVKVEPDPDDSAKYKGTYTSIESRFSSLDDIVMSNKIEEIQRWQCGICYKLAINVSKPSGINGPCECVTLYCATCLDFWIQKEGKCPICRKTSLHTYRDLSAQNDITNLKVFRCPIKMCNYEKQTLENLRQHFHYAHDQSFLEGFRSSVFRRLLEKTRCELQDKNTVNENLMKQVQQFQSQITQRNGQNNLKKVLSKAQDELLKLEVLQEKVNSSLSLSELHQIIMNIAILERRDAVLEQGRLNQSPNRSRSPHRTRPKEALTLFAYEGA